MKKKEIFLELEKLSLDPSEYIIIGGAALVCLGIKSETKDIDLSCSKEVYDKLNWENRTSYFNTEIKYNDCFEIGPNFYTKDYDVINGYRFMK